jgi:5-methylcytosine-specific restriction endonuclease McrA/DNA-binding CsgD family transcriptional regulator
MLNKIEKEVLYRLYYVEKKTMQEIGNLYNCNRKLISKLLRKYDLRDGTRFLSLRIGKKRLIKLYIENDFTIDKISKMLGCASSTIVSRLELFKIPRKSHSEETTIIKIKKEELEKLYIVDKKSSIAIAKFYGCSKNTILKNLKKFGINRRTSKESLMLGNYKGINSALWKGGPPKCQICGIILKGSKSKHCKECNKTFQSARNSGKNNPMYGIRRFGKDNPNYMDGRSSLNSLIRDLSEYNEWRKQVFERDNYTCQECGDNSGGNLHAHHIKPFAIILLEFLNKFNRFSPLEEKEILLRLSLDYEDFWKVLNGKTLCNKCHDSLKKDTINTIIQNKNREIKNERII